MKKEFLQLLEKAEQNSRKVQKVIDERFREIYDDIFNFFNSNVSWYTYDNCSDNHDGYFDIVRYKYKIEINGEFTKRTEMSILLKDDSIWDLSLGIPTRWLYENYSHELISGRELYLYVFLIKI
ncbi:MAG: hypothetical protein ACOCUI_00150 [bacterium]